MKRVRSETDPATRPTRGRLPDRDPAVGITRESLVIESILNKSATSMDALVEEPRDSAEGIPLRSDCG